MPMMELQTGERPLASFVLLAYNNAAFVAEALRSAFSQTYRPLQIIVSDDASTDATWRLVNDMAGECPANMELVLRRNPTNLGVAGNLQAAVAASSGAIIIQAADDDVAEPSRTTALVAAFAEPEVMAVGSANVVIDADGQALATQSPAPALKITLDSLMKSPNVFGGATASYRRTVFESFPPMPGELRHEDMLLVMRAALLGKVKILPDRLVRYRQHSGHSTGSVSGRARSRQEYLASAKRHAKSLWLARRQQLADLAEAVAEGQVDTKVAADVAEPLADQLRDFAWAHGLLTGELRGSQVLRQAIAAKRPPRAIAKLMAMNLYPSLWYWWLRLRR
jgi:GT2 family glycosyltransferase